MVASIFRNFAFVVLATAVSAAQAGDSTDAVSAASKAVSINSTSQGRLGGSIAATPIPPLTQNPAYRLIVANDLGMHCGDLDDRIATILPPFNVVHAQVLQRAARPKILDDKNMSVVYSASAQPNDPALAKSPVVAADKSIFKTNFWDTAVSTYSAFYPPGVLSTYLSPSLPKHGADVGLPVPNLERLYLGDGKVELNQQTMPSITRFTTDANGVPKSVVSAPYKVNRPQEFKAFETSLPLFKNFPFGYVADNVKWFAAEGIPIAPFDDVGRENAYPLLRFQAKLKSTGRVVASLDAVTPVAAESDCKSCHLPSPLGNGLATKRLTRPAVPAHDPRKGHVLQWVSEEWAADINMLRVHDLKHGTTLYSGYNAVTGIANKPVACQSCHYTPALDLLHLGPQDAHGLTQGSHETMSRVMHNGHGRLRNNGVLIFPTMPPPNDSRRTQNQATTPINAFEQNRLEATCYQCHPGKRTECLRGTMAAKAGTVCQDCHGGMTQVGDDFSRNKPAGNFIVASDFYTNPKTPRVPWANEPTCGSCHTGDANSNLAKAPGVIAAPDAIRLLQAYLKTDAKATPILPTNLRFAEERVRSGPATGNPQLYRLSVDRHGGVFCEGCHGSTHAEWPTADPRGNDNVAAAQLQGHSGRIMECDTCHTGTMAASLSGPHGMHPVGNAGNSAVWVSRHGDYAETHGLTDCAACHGRKGEGTVLGVTAVARPGLSCEQGSLCKGGEAKITLAANTQVSCGLCHGNPFTGGLGALRVKSGAIP